MSTEITTRPSRTTRENPLALSNGSHSSSLEPVALQILSDAGHDFRSPLSGIRSAIQALAAEDLGPLNPSQSELLTDALAQCDSLLNLSENMLSITRLQQNNLGLPCAWVEPYELYKSIRKGLESIARVKNIRVLWEGFASFRFPLFGDKTALKRLIYNLAGNAIQASPENSEVCVTLRRGKDSQLAEIVTSDSGSGIHPSALNKISQRGFSGQNRTGWGLAICQTLASYQLTRLQVQTSLDGGSQFSFEVAYGHINSVAKLYAKWRTTIYEIEQNKRSSRRSQEAPEASEIQTKSISVTNEHQASVLTSLATTTLRVDPAFAPSTNSTTAPQTYPSAMYLPVHQHQPQHPSAFVATQLHLPAAHQSSAFGGTESIEEMNRFVQSQQRPHELVFRYDDVHWFMFWDCDNHACHQRQKQFASDFQSRFAVLPTFEKPVLVRIAPELRDTESTQKFIQELMLRSILLGRLPHANSHVASPLRRRKSKPDRVSHTEVRSSQTVDDLLINERHPTTWNRIDEEIRQLRMQLSNQARRLSDHADRLNR